MTSDDNTDFTQLLQAPARQSTPRTHTEVAAALYPGRMSLTAAQVAEVLGVSVRTAYRLMDTHPEACYRAGRARRVRTHLITTLTT